VEDFRQHEQRVLDRLADGELTPTDRRDLLLALDDEPGAWRRCALTLLEHQALREELRPAVQERIPARVNLATRSIHAANDVTRRARRFAVVVALAASLLLAFGFGWEFGGRAKLAGGGNSADGPRLTSQPQSIQPAPVEKQLAQANIGPAIAASGDESDNQWHTFKLGIEDEQSGSSREIEVSAVSAERLDDDWLASLGSAVPDDLLAALKAAGHEVHRSHRLLPIELADGRRLVVPVEELDVEMSVEATPETHN
jgi:hypothetical protein